MPIAAAALIAGACRGTDVTGLPTLTHLTVTVDTVRGPTMIGAPPTLTVQCTVDLKGKFESPDPQVHAAAWLHARRLIYIGGTRVDSVDIAAPTVSATWGGPIGNSTTMSSSWTVSAAAPFSAAFVFTYLIQGRGTGAARVEFTCGEPWSNAPKPQITAFSVTPTSGDVEPGDTIRVNYSATSPIDFWSSSVVLSGACDFETAFDERGKRSLSRTAIVLVPPACRPGETVSVSVLVTNLAGASDTARAASGPRVIDVTPPTASVSFFSPHSGSPIPTIGTRTWFSDDSIFAYVQGRDNQSVTRLFWEVQPAGFIDSIVVPTPAASYASLVTIRLQRAWVGRQALRFYVRDAAGHVSDTIGVPAAPDSLRIYPDTSYPAVTQSLSGTVNAVAIDAVREALYVLQPSQGRVVVLSLATLAPTDTIAIGGFATDLDLSAGGDSLVLALSYTGALGIVDLQAVDPVMTTLPMPGLDPSFTERPAQLRVAANGKAIVTTSGSASYKVWEVNLGTGASRVRTDAGQNGVFGVGSVGRAPNHGSVVLQGDANSFQRYEAASDTFGPRANGLPARLLPSLDSAGTRVALRTNVYNGALSLVRQVDIPDGGFSPGPSVLSVDGTILYYAIARRSILLADAGGGGLLARVRLAALPSQLYVSDDGRWLVAIEASPAAATVSVLRIRP
ncbi:MAG TPA: hypothetical protein VFO67_04905 [Gemmatimonadales bacterium]|nr:hypothetical protein [Gemmatimonadales bacterium]